MATPSQLRKLIARVEGRLRNKKLTRYQLLDLATVLVFVHHALELQTGREVEAHALLPEAETADSTLAAMNDHLQILLTSSDLASDDEIRDRVKDALRHAVTAVAFLAAGTARQ